MKNWFDVALAKVFAAKESCQQNYKLENETGLSKIKGKKLSRLMHDLMQCYLYTLSPHKFYGLYMAYKRHALVIKLSSLGNDDVHYLNVVYLQIIVFSNVDIFSSSSSKIDLRNLRRISTFSQNSIL